MDRDIDVLTNSINIFKSYLGDLIIVGRNGFAANLASSPDIIAGYDFFNASWMKDVTKSNKDGVHFIPPHKCDYYYPAFKPYDMAISAVMPVKQNKSVIGYIICDINIKGLNNIFDTLNLVEGGCIYMVDGSGKTVFHPDPASIGSKVNPVVVDMISNNNSGSFIYRNLKDKRYW